MRFKSIYIYTIIMRYMTLLIALIVSLLAVSVYACTWPKDPEYIIEWDLLYYIEYDACNNNDIVRKSIITDSALLDNYWLSLRDVPFYAKIIPNKYKNKYYELKFWPNYVIILALEYSLKIIVPIMFFALVISLFIGYRKK